MNLIAAVTGDWGIGKEHRLLLSIPEDMKFFRETTAGAVVIMGRKTLESFPNGKPLKGRTNIVLTGNPDFSVDGVIAVSGLDEALAELKKYDTESIFVVGGESVYRLLLPYCRYAYITKMDILAEADRFMPDLDALPEWSVISESETKYYENVPYRFLRYANSNVIEI